MVAAPLVLPQAFRKFANRREIAAAPVNLQELRIRGISCEFAAGREIARSAAISPWRDIAADPRIRSGREFAADPRIFTKPNLQMVRGPCAVRGPGR